MSKPYGQGPRLGKPVTYVDPRGVEHAAVVTADWGDGAIEFPSLNVVFVTDDSTKQDPYGNQIERSTSVPHESNRGGAHGNFWRD